MKIWQKSFGHFEGEKCVVLEKLVKGRPEEENGGGGQKGSVEQNFYLFHSIMLLSFCPSLQYYYKTFIIFETK